MNFLLEVRFGYTTPRLRDSDYQVDCPSTGSIGVRVNSHSIEFRVRGLEYFITIPHVSLTNAVYSVNLKIS